MVNTKKAKNKKKTEPDFVDSDDDFEVANDSGTQQPRKFNAGKYYGPPMLPIEWHVGATRFMFKTCKFCRKRCKLCKKKDELSDEDGPRPSKNLKISKRTSFVKKPKKSSSLPPASEADDREQPAARPSASSPMAGPSAAKRAKVASLSKTPASISKSMASTPVNGSQGAGKRKSKTPKHITKTKYPFLESDDEDEDKLQIVEIDDDDSEKDPTEVRPVGQDEGSGQGEDETTPEKGNSSNTTNEKSASTNETSSRNEESVSSPVNVRTPCSSDTELEKIFEQRCLSPKENVTQEIPSLDYVRPGLLTEEDREKVRNFQFSFINNHFKVRTSDMGVVLIRKLAAQFDLCCPCKTAEGEYQDVCEYCCAEMTQICLMQNDNDGKLSRNKLKDLFYKQDGLLSNLFGKLKGEHQEVTLSLTKEIEEIRNELRELQEAYKVQKAALLASEECRRRLLNQVVEQRRAYRETVDTAKKLVDAVVAKYKVNLSDKKIGALSDAIVKATTNGIYKAAMADWDKVLKEKVNVNDPEAVKAVLLAALDEEMGIAPLPKEQAKPGSSRADTEIVLGIFEDIKKDVDVFLAKVLEKVAARGVDSLFEKSDDANDVVNNWKWVFLNPLLHKIRYQYTTRWNYAVLQKDSINNIESGFFKNFPVNHSCFVGFKNIIPTSKCVLNDKGKYVVEKEHEVLGTLVVLDAAVHSKEFKQFSFDKDRMPKDPSKIKLPKMPKEPSKGECNPKPLQLKDAMKRKRNERTPLENGEANEENDANNCADPSHLIESENTSRLGISFHELHPIVVGSCDEEDGEEEVPKVKGKSGPGTKRKGKP